jgi:hypothetical protein
METKVDKIKIENFATMSREAQHLALQMEKALDHDARCVSVIMACCIIIEISRRNMPGTPLEDLVEILPDYMLVAHMLLGKSENEKSQDDE